MAKRVKFYVEDEKEIIDFVKNHEILFNVHHKLFRDTEARNRLWQQLAAQLGKEVEPVKKRWKTMRDYFIRRKYKKTNRSSSHDACIERDEALMFLMDPSVLKRSTLRYMSSPVSPSVASESFVHDLTLKFENEDDASNDTVNETLSNTECSIVRDKETTPDSERTPSMLFDESPRRGRRRSDGSCQDHSETARVSKARATKTNGFSTTCTKR